MDNEGRTPLHLGADLDRTEAVHFLLTLKEKPPSRCDVYDINGFPALTSMIINMPQTVRIFLPTYMYYYCTRHCWHWINFIKYSLMREDRSIILIGSNHNAVKLRLL